jgi:hypothetical protein
MSQPIRWSSALVLCLIFTLFGCGRDKGTRSSPLLLPPPDGNPDYLPEPDPDIGEEPDGEGPDEGEEDYPTACEETPGCTPLLKADVRTLAGVVRQDGSTLLAFGTGWGEESEVLLGQWSRSDGLQPVATVPIGRMGGDDETPDQPFSLDLLEGTGGPLLIVGSRSVRAISSDFGQIQTMDLATGGQGPWAVRAVDFGGTPVVFMVDRMGEIRGSLSRGGIWEGGTIRKASERPALLPMISAAAHQGRPVVATLRGVLGGYTPAASGGSGGSQGGEAWEPFLFPELRDVCSFDLATLPNGRIAMAALMPEGVFYAERQEQQWYGGFIEESEIAYGEGFLCSNSDFRENESNRAGLRLSIDDEGRPTIAWTMFEKGHGVVAPGPEPEVGFGLRVLRRYNEPFEWTVDRAFTDEHASRAYTPLTAPFFAPGRRDFFFVYQGLNVIRRSRPNG